MVQDWAPLFLGLTLDLLLLVRVAEAYEPLFDLFEEVELLKWSLPRFFLPRVHFYSLQISVADVVVFFFFDLMTFENPN